MLHRILTARRMGLGLLLLLGGCAACALMTRDAPTYQAFHTEGGVLVQDLKVPTRDDLPYLRGGETVTIHFTATLPDGSAVDSSLDRAEPLTFELGDGSVPPGLVEGLLGMRELGTRRMTLPAALAYGEDGVPGRVPPGSDVLFEVELLDVEGGVVPPSRLDEPDDDRGFDGFDE